MIPIFLHYNNYYNRTVKHFETADEYMAAAGDENYFIVEFDTNWQFNDGITTTYDFNDELNSGDFIYDYMLLCERDADYTINSRWFVVESVYNRRGQHKLTLRRDVIADNYYNVLAAPTFIEKATAAIDDPAIYNSENMTFNQIKSGEYLISDNSLCPWIAVYMAKKDSKDTTLPDSFSVEQEPLTPNYTLGNLSNYEYGAYATEQYIGPYSALQLGIKLKSAYTDSSVAFSWDGAGDFIGEDWSNSGIGISWNGKDIAGIRDIIAAEVSGYNWEDTSYDYTPANKTADILAEDGKIIKVGDDYFRVKVVQTANKAETVAISRSSDLGIKMEGIARTFPGVNMSSISGDPYFITYSAPAYNIIFNIIKPGAASFNLPAGRATTLDTVYDVFMMPAGDYYLYDGQNNIECSGELSMRFAAAIGQHPDKVIFDVQLLPYGPVLDEDITNSPDTDKKTISVAGKTRDVDYTFITYEGATLGLVLFLSDKDFQKKLYKSFNTLQKATNAIEKKVNNECNMMRLVSPNYDGYFEYNTEKIGDPRYYNVYCTLKPYQPYICVSPDFNSSLYGRNYGDSRGLICGGNFSLPRSVDQWLTYHLNNKNYQAIFNRQIQNMEVNNSAARVSEIAGIVGGAASGAASGAIVGSMIPGIGTAVGAVVGGLFSAGAGAVDYAMNERLRNEALDYTKDLFGYQLGNIKALPDVLTSVGAYDITNKVFPFVEYYTATDIEKEALRNKIKYNGMTIMRIGTIGEFQKGTPTYIKGKIIRLEGLFEDYHFARTIAEEINQGVFI